MRNLALSSMLLIGALGAPAHADRVALAGSTTVGRGTQLTTGELGITARAPRKAAFLEAREVAAEVRPYAAEIQRCYLARLGDVRRAGKLDLTFVIGRDGRVVSLHVDAPGLPARTVQHVQSCIHEAVAGLQFPERRNDTTAIVPYLFQHTNAPGGGPQLSCWNPKGCRT